MERPIFLQSINKQFECNLIVALLGPRQSGKTTLAKLTIIYPGEKSYYLDKNIQVVGLDEYCGGAFKI
jgi:predicted AAA+ superfamily ATPase